VTALDVARRAGVSRAAVSVVLNGARSNARVSDATRRSIVEAAEELGYSPHPDAQALRRQRSGVLGLVRRASAGSFMEDVISYLLSEQVFHAAERKGYRALLVGPETAEDRSGAHLQPLFSRRVEGVIFDNPASVEDVRLVTERGIPVVQVLRPQFEAQTHTVTVDAPGGLDAAIAHLVALGHTRIGFIGIDAAHPIDRTRREAVVGALAARGLAPAPELLQLAKGFGLEGGRAGMQTLLSVPEPPTAVVAASDSLALGALHALYAAGVTVPARMSVVSYDDAIAADLYPPLTSVAQPLSAVAEHAVALVTAGADEPDEPAHVRLPARLVVRESSGPPGGRSSP